MPPPGQSGQHRSQQRVTASPSVDQTVGSGRSSRTSCAQRHTTAILAAHFSASSREGTSTTANPPMTSLVSGYGPSVTVPSVATTLALWLSSPALKTHTPASWASRTTLSAALVTSGRSSSGKVIAPSSNEIRYRVIPWLLCPGDLSGRLSPHPRTTRSGSDTLPEEFLTGLPALPPVGRGGVSGTRSRRCCPPARWLCRRPRAPFDCGPAGAAGRRGSHGRRDSRPACPRDGRRPPVPPPGRQARRPRWRG